MSENTYSPGAVATVEGGRIKMPKHEIVLVVKFNNEEGLILKESINLTYYKFGSDTIIATDGVFYNFYMKDWASWSKDAFGGRKFTLIMHDGEIVECSGQWWDARSPTAKMLIDQPLCSGTANDLASMQKCYVFNGHCADAQKWKELRATYTGPVYDYSDGEFIIKSWQKRPAKAKCFIFDYNGNRCLVDENDNVFSMRVIHGKLYIKYNISIGWHGLYSGFHEGRRDFSGHKQKAVKPDFGTCTNCEKRDAWFEWDNGDALCHLCNKEAEQRENNKNYSY